MKVKASGDDEEKNHFTIRLLKTSAPFKIKYIQMMKGKFRSLIKPTDFYKEKSMMSLEHF